MTPTDAKARRIDQPAPGWFKVKLVKGGPWVPARIYLAAEIGKASVEIERVWEYGHMIDEPEWRRLMDRLGIVPLGEPVDLNRLPPLEF